MLETSLYSKVSRQSPFVLAEKVVFAPAQLPPLRDLSSLANAPVDRMLFQSFRKNDDAGKLSGIPRRCYSALLNVFSLDRKMFQESTGSRDRPKVREFLGDRYYNGDSFYTA